MKAAVTVCETRQGKLELTKVLAAAIFMEGIIFPVCDDDVVEKVDIHHFAGTV